MTGPIRHWPGEGINHFKDIVSREGAKLSKEILKSPLKEESRETAGMNPAHGDEIRFL